MLEHHRCLRDYTGTCDGPVEGRASYAGTGTTIYECQRHAEESLEKHLEHSRIYPDSDIAPDWFDESAAGERWNDDY